MSYWQGKKEFEKESLKQSFKLYAFPNQNNTNYNIENKDISESQEKGEIEMPTIRFRKDNRYELRFCHNSKQYSVYDKDKNKLHEKYLKKLKQVKKNKHILQQTTGTNYSLKDWFVYWLKTYKEPFITYPSLRNIEMYFNKHILPKFGTMKLKAITIEVIQPWLNKMERSRTKELIITYFNACLAKAKDLGYILKNPFDLVVREKKIKNIRRAFTIEEQELILNYAIKTDFEFYKLIMFYLCTGVRRNEALSILFEDFENNYLHIKGTKTEKSDRIIELTPTLKNLIYKDGKIFNFKSDYVSHKFKDILDALNIKGTLHCLRHSYATNQYFLGTPAKEVQINMGHSEISITLDIYTNIQTKDDKNKIKEKIKALYNGYYIELES